jgi:hypothetical protein
MFIAFAFLETQQTVAGVTAGIEMCAYVCARQAIRRTLKIIWNVDDLFYFNTTF